MAFIKEFVALFSIMFIGLTLIGFLFKYFRSKEWIKQISNRLIPTSWDYRFGKINKAEWLRVTLKDGTKVAGYFGTNSFASSIESERDLYLEEMYTSTYEVWERVVPPCGILIKGEEIKYIEFLGDKQEAIDV